MILRLLTLDLIAGWSSSFAAVLCPHCKQRATVNNAGDDISTKTCLSNALSYLNFGITLSTCSFAS